jgi:SAM-dependent methyltransferase
MRRSISSAPLAVVGRRKPEGRTRTSLLHRACAELGQRASRDMSPATIRAMTSRDRPAEPASIAPATIVQSFGRRALVRVDQKLSAKVLKRVGQLRRLGARGVAHTAYVRTLGPAVYSLTDPARNVARGVHRQKVVNGPLETRLARLKTRVGEEIGKDPAPLLRDIDPQADARLAADRAEGAERIIGKIAADGSVQSLIGSIHGLRTSRGKNGDGDSALQLVDIDGRLGARRTFGRNRGQFVQALEAMLDLAAAGCAIPPVIHVDWNANAITCAFVRGTPFRDSELPAERLSQIREAIGEKLIDIHRAGYVLDVIARNSVVIADDGNPLFVGLQHALPLAGLSRDMSVYLRDGDSRQANSCFGTELITAEELRTLRAPRALGAHAEGRQSNDFFVPVVLRDDIRWGKIWNPDVGSGRWNVIMKDHLPIPRGGSVLDLGSNNGFNPLQMLRSGAASAVGVEINEQVIREGEFLKAAYEWLDNRCYDFRYIHGSQGDLPIFDLPRFDVVTALCSLYYMREKEIRDLVRYIRTLTDVLVLQCNIDRLIDRRDEETYRKASVEFALEVLGQAGFSSQEVIAPAGYSRPLVIGRP